jgi:hypothetical protein
MRLRILLIVALLVSGVARGQTWILVDDGEWVPDEATAGDLVRSVEAAFAQAARDQSQDVPPWSSYTIQYQGRLIDGQPVIAVSGACSDIADRMSRDWDLEKVFVGIADGGPCAFYATYDMRTKRLLGFLFNGFA